MTTAAKLNEYNQVVVSAMSEQNNIGFGDTTIDYEVRRSARRRKTVQQLDSGQMSC